MDRRMTDGSGSTRNNRSSSNTSSNTTSKTTTKKKAPVTRRKTKKEEQLTELQFLDAIKKLPPREQLGAIWRNSWSAFGFFVILIGLMYFSFVWSLPASYNAIYFTFPIFWQSAMGAGLVQFGPSWLWHKMHTARKDIKFVWLGSYILVSGIDMYTNFVEFNYGADIIGMEPEHRFIGYAFCMGVVFFEELIISVGASLATKMWYIWLLIDIWRGKEVSTSNYKKGRRALENASRQLGFGNLSS